MKCNGTFIGWRDNILLREFAMMFVYCLVFGTAKSSQRAITRAQREPVVITLEEELDVDYCEAYPYSMTFGDCYVPHTVNIIGVRVRKVWGLDNAKEARAI